jgi:hypothetical protein
VPGAAASTAAATVPAGTPGSITAIIPATIAAGSLSLPSGWQAWQCGRPARSRTQTGLLSPQRAHDSGRGPQAPQYQS